ncbi:MAG: HlyD family efflux transporter periplasmic adaptor subunit [Verrucomicrobiae bacterium]|nr:HlyD family efflux transporter periplasmic adaptor subunit [Verrucomicrobiae bacterium]
MPSPEQPDSFHPARQAQENSAFGFSGRPAFSGRPEYPLLGEATMETPRIPDGADPSASSPGNPSTESTAFPQKVDPVHHARAASAIVPAKVGGNSVDPPDFSYDVQEIMAKTPHWLLRSGTTVIAAVLAIVLFLTWMIRYPDSITGTMEIAGANPAVDVVARQSGHIESLHVKEGDLVEKGQVLAVIESTIPAARVFSLKERLSALTPFLSDASKFELIEIEAEEQLGKLQTSYSQFLSDYIALREIFGDDYAERTVRLLSLQAEEQKKRISNLEGQIANADRTVQLARERYERMEKLLRRDTLSIAEYEEQENELLSVEAAKAEVVRAMNAERVSALDLEKQISDLRHQREVVVREGITKLQESLKQLLSGIDIWEEDYVLKAPVAGRVAFLDFWANTQFVAGASQVFVVAPESTSLVGRMEVKGKGVGKIQPGQPVQIRFSDYDYKEFGIVTGSVRNASIVPRKGGNHLVVVDLEFPLVTNFGREVPFKQAMQAEASIVTEDLRLIERIFYELRRAITDAAKPKGDPEPAAVKV